ncbi:hypothetical protein JCM8202_000410 [Rhodotorula sphaerocarpa]
MPSLASSGASRASPFDPRSSWIARACVLGVICFYLAYRQTRPPLGWARYQQAQVPGGELEVLGDGEHRNTVVFIHGLGANAAQLQVALPAYTVERIRPSLPHTAFVLPSSQFLRMTALDGMPSQAWFDMRALPFMAQGPIPVGLEDIDGLTAAVKRIHRTVRNHIEQRGIPEERIVLAGFSQGCAVALLSALSYPGKLAGVACISGWLPFSERINREGPRHRHPVQTEHAHHLPVFWGHGTADPMVLHSWAYESIEDLSMMGFENISFHSYPGLGHDIRRSDLEHDLTAWLQQRLPVS